MTTSGTTNDNECQRVTIPANFSFFFQIKEEPTTKHPKENFLNLEEDFWGRTIKLRAETSTQKVNSKKQELQKQLFADFYQNSVLKNFAIFSGFKTCNFLKRRHQHRCFRVLESLFKKVAGFEARKSIKRRHQHRCFAVNIANFLKTAFSIEHLWWLLLELRHFLVCDV